MIITPIQLRWSDFDIFKHVYNGNYQQYYDLGKSEYFEIVLGFATGWAVTPEGIITAATSTNYLSSVEMDETIEVRTRVEHVGNKSITIYQEICDSLTGVVKSNSKSVMVGYNPLDKITLEIPEKWRKAIAEEENQK